MKNIPAILPPVGPEEPPDAGRQAADESSFAGARGYFPPDSLEFKAPRHYLFICLGLVLAGLAVLIVAFGTAGCRTVSGGPTTSRRSVLSAELPVGPPALRPPRQFRRHREAGRPPLTAGPVAAAVHPATVPFFRGSPVPQTRDALG